MKGALVPHKRRATHALHKTGIAQDVMHLGRHQPAPQLLLLVINKQVPIMDALLYVCLLVLTV
jgi:hypothetical protein